MPHDCVCVLSKWSAHVLSMDGSSVQWLVNFPWPAHGLWLTGGHFVGTLSAMAQLGQLSLPTLWGHVITWTTVVDTIVPRARAVGGCMAAGSRVRVCRHALQPKL